MLPASRSGKTRTFALPATELPGAFLLADLGEQGGVGLELAVDLHIRLDLPGDLQGLEHLVAVGMAGAPLGGEGEQGHAGVHVQESLAVAGRGNGDLGQGLGIRVGIDGTVGEQDDTVLAEACGLGDHQEEGGDGLDPLGRADGLEGGLEHVAGGAGGAGHLAPGVADFDHHAGVIQVVRCGEKACGPLRGSYPWLLRSSTNSARTAPAWGSRPD